MNEPPRVGDLLWRNGALVPSDTAQVHVSAVGHASVAATFDGIHAYWNNSREELLVFRLEEHIQRFLGSMQLARLHTSWSSAELIQGTLALLRASGASGDTYIRPWCFVAGDRHREQMVPPDAEVEVVIALWSFESKLPSTRTATAAIPSWTRISPNTMPPRIKAFANYHNGRFGNIEALERGADWPIFLDAAAHVTESSGAAVAVVKNGRVEVPHNGDGLLESVTRATVATLLTEECSVEVRERDLGRTDVYMADEIIFLGTSAEVTPIVRVDGRSIGDGRVGPMARLIADKYHSCVRGLDGTRPEWRTAVWNAES